MPRLAFDKYYSCLLFKATNNQLQGHIQVYCDTRLHSNIASTGWELAAQGSAAQQYFWPDAAETKSNFSRLQ